jgi:hypothetical protein
MKYIKLKTLTTRKQNFDGSYITLDYREHIENIACEVSAQNQAGFDRSTNRKALRIMKALDNTKVGANILTLEDADWEFLKERSQSYAFRFADPAIEEFFTDIDDAASDYVEKAEATGV